MAKPFLIGDWLFAAMNNNKKNICQFYGEGKGRGTYDKDCMATVNFASYFSYLNFGTKFYLPTKTICLGIYKL